jgi:uncharacterized protein GlcG (DUF336 family)
MRHTLPQAVAAVSTVPPLVSAVGQVDERGCSLPLAIALKAAAKVMAACARNGYPVSAVVVDFSGIIKLETEGDQSTVQTITSAYRKAYTVVTFGPIFRFDAPSTFAALVAKNSNGAAFATLPEIPPLAGSVAA